MHLGIALSAMQLSIIYDFTCGALPKPLQALFDINEIYHEYKTRQAANPHIKRYENSIVINSFINKAPKCWSELPVETKQAPSKNSFAKRAKKYF